MLPSTPAYPQGKIPINKNKIVDLLKLKIYLPQNKRVQHFYKNIFKWPVTDKDENEVIDNYN